MIVALIGGAVGLATAALLLHLLNRWPPAAEAHLAANLDVRVYLAGLALSLASALLFGMLPALQARQSSPLQSMKSGTAEFLRFRRFASRDLLLGAQIAICTLMVTASLIAVRGLEQTLNTPMGFQPKGAMLAQMDVAQLAKAGDAALEKEKVMVDTARGIPGVTGVGLVNRMPMTGGHGTPIYRAGTTEFKLSDAALAPYVYSMSPGYLDAAGTRLLNGRDISWRDTAKTPYIAIINETFARKMWGERSAIGEHFILWGNLTEVVGVAENGKYHDLQESPQPAVYLPYPQSNYTEVKVVVRSQRPSSE